MTVNQTKQNVLILSAGRRVSLVRAFQTAAKAYAAKVFTADMKPDFSAACQISDGAFYLPHVKTEQYDSALLQLCQTHGIGIVIPTIDTELLRLADLRQDFAAHGIRIVVSDQAHIRACRDKRLTHQLFDRIGLAYPHTYSPEQIRFPCFAKPVSGSLSQNIRILHDQAELDSWKVDPAQMLFMEVISAEQYREYTVDCYFGLDHQLKMMVPRLRYEVRGGEVSKGITDKSLLALLLPYFRQLPGAVGCQTIQLFRHKDADQVLGIEINPRFGGGYPLSYLAGADFPALLLRELLAKESLSYSDDWQDKLMMLRYDAEILVPNADYQ